MVYYNYSYTARLWHGSSLEVTLDDATATYLTSIFYFLTDQLVHGGASRAIGNLRERLSSGAIFVDSLLLHSSIWCGLLVSYFYFYFYFYVSSILFS